MQFQQIFGHISGNAQNEPVIDEAFFEFMSQMDELEAKLYTPSTLNIDLILWHTQLIMCAVK